MRKIKGKHLMFIILAVLCLCIYACYDGVDFPSGKSSRLGKSKKKNKELTTAIARQWFETNMTPVVTMRSSEAKDVQAAMVKPKWEDAYEANRGRYEVVQTPILTRGRRMFVDAETQSEFEKIRGQKYLRNAARMVIRKDLKTGEIRSFIAIFVGSLDYMKKSKKMGRNSYLYRESDFDGKVLFFEPNGGLINGWKYRNGKIIGKIMPIDEETKMILTRGGEWIKECYMETDFELVEVCHEEVFIEPDKEYGEAWGVEIVCDEVLQPFEYEVCEDNWVEDDDDDFISGDVDPDLDSEPDFGEDDFKEPEAKEDCTDGEKRSKSANTVINYNDGIKQEMKSLKEKASDKNYEYSTRIDYNSKGIVMADIEKISVDDTGGNFTASTIYGLHTHNGGGGGYTGPSVEDIYTILAANEYFYTAYGTGNYNFHGGIICTNDGSEYLVTFTDRKIAADFFQQNGALFEHDPNNNFFKNTDMYNEFMDIISNLNEQGYSKQDRYDFSMSYMLDKYSTGIVISKKEESESDFKEMETDFDTKNNKYIPKKCQ